MAKKRSKTVRHNKIHHNPAIVSKRRLPRDKSEALMALMALILIVLCAVLDWRIAVGVSVALIGIFAVYKLFKKSGQ